VIVGGARTGRPSIPAGAPLGPVRALTALPSRRRADAPLGLPSPAHPGSRRVRACSRGAGAWFRLTADSHPGLLGLDNPAAGPRVGGGGLDRHPPRPGAPAVRPPDRAGVGGLVGPTGGLGDAPVGRQGWALAGGPREAGLQALDRDRWGGHPAAPSGPGRWWTSTSSCRPRSSPCAPSSARRASASAGPADPPPAASSSRLWSVAVTPAEGARSPTTPAGPRAPRARRSPLRRPRE
jgi:hypothetical protein